MGAYQIVAWEKMQMKFMSLNVPENIVSISWTKSSTNSVIPNLIRDLRCGWIEEFAGVNCQETTKDELLKSLTITLKEALEFNRQEGWMNVENDFGIV